MTSTDPKTPLTNNPNKNGELEPPNAPKKAAQEKHKNVAATSQSLQEIQASKDGRGGSM